ncbi:MAG: hypothetical protein GY866_11525, partial [Proteobacteria bacterium]|nr:hypothetical protein [Pseudomonadota bacterium]
DMTFDAMENDVFYIFTEMMMKKGVENRHESIMNGFDALEKYLEKNNLK